MPNQLIQVTSKLVRARLIDELLPDIVGETPRLAHPDQRAGHFHQRLKVQGPLQGGLVQLGSTGEPLIRGSRLKIQGSGSSTRMAHLTVFYR